MNSLFVLFCLFFASASSFDAQQALNYAVRQYSILAHSREKDDLFISNGDKNNLEWVTSANSTAWTVGFYVGALWKLYKLTNDEYWKEQALHKQETVRHRQFDESTHDVGFVIMSTFGNGLAITGDKSFEPIIVRAADSLATRFHCKWDFDPIIDNDHFITFITISSPVWRLSILEQRCKSRWCRR